MAVESRVKLLVDVLLGHSDLKDAFSGANKDIKGMTASFNKVIKDVKKTKKEIDFTKKSAKELGLVLKKIPSKQPSLIKGKKGKPSDEFGFFKSGVKKPLDAENRAAEFKKVMTKALAPPKARKKFDFEKDMKPAEAGITGLNKRLATMDVVAKKSGKGVTEFFSKFDSKKLNQKQLKNLSRDIKLIEKESVKAAGGAKRHAQAEKIRANELKKSKNGMFGFGRAMGALSFLFLGQQISAWAKRTGMATVTTFTEIMHASNIATNSITMLTAGFKFLKFTVGNAINEALGPLLPTLMRIIEGTADWVNQHKGFTLLALGFIGVAGTMALVAAQLILLISGVKALIGPMAVKQLATFGGGITGIGKAIWAWIGANVILSAIIAVIIILAAVLISTWVKFPETFTPVKEAAKGVADEFKNMVGSIVDAVAPSEEFGNGWTRLGMGISAVLAFLLDGLGGFLLGLASIADFFTSISMQAESMLNKVANVITGIKMAAAGWVALKSGDYTKFDALKKDFNSQKELIDDLDEKIYDFHKAKQDHIKEYAAGVKNPAEYYREMQEAMNPTETIEIELDPDKAWEKLYEQKKSPSESPSESPLELSSGPIVDLGDTAATTQEISQLMNDTFANTSTILGEEMAPAMSTFNESLNDSEQFFNKLNTEADEQIKKAPEQVETVSTLTTTYNGLADSIERAAEAYATLAEAQSSSGGDEGTDDTAANDQ